MNTRNTQAFFPFRIYTPSFFPLVLACTILSGCVIAAHQHHPAGTGLVRSMEVEYIFLSKKLLPDHQYYFTGSENDPDAILAVRKDVHFTKGLWSSIDLNQKKLSFWITFIEDATRSWNCPWFGSYVIDPAGEKLALYYSKYDYTVVKFPKPGSLVVYPPDPLTGTRTMRMFSPCIDDDF